MSYLPLLSALVPAILLLGYIYWQDRKSPEPIKQLFLATALGVLAIPLTLCIVKPLQSVGIVADQVSTIADAINLSFLGAAIPEELCKLVILWLFLRKNPYFDERMDGIVYAVCVSLGFAGLENIYYVIDGDANWMAIALARGIVAVPGHFCYGVIMGYFYSLAQFDPNKRLYHSAMALIAPVVAHGLYDLILCTIALRISTGVILLLFLVFLVFCFYLWKWASRSIKRHVGR